MGFKGWITAIEFIIIIAFVVWDLIKHFKNH